MARDESEDYDDDDLSDDERGPEVGVSIDIVGLSLYTHHGVSAAEREVGQRLVPGLANGRAFWRSGLLGPHLLCRPGKARRTSTPHRSGPCLPEITVHGWMLREARTPASKTFSTRTTQLFLGVAAPPQRGTVGAVGVPALHATRSPPGRPVG